MRRQVCPVVSNAKGVSGTLYVAGEEDAVIGAVWYFLKVIMIEPVLAAVVRFVGVIFREE
jgi:hypothetical protein